MNSLVGTFTCGTSAPPSAMERSTEEALDLVELTFRVFTGSNNLAACCASKSKRAPSLLPWGGNTSSSQR